MKNLINFYLKLSLVLSLLLLTNRTIAQDVDANTSKTPTILLTNDSCINSFSKHLDDIFGQKMEKYHIPGAVFVLVKEGKVILQKGYGYADLENKVPVNPDSTIFRVGSVSKLVTATAAMQLNEKDKIDLFNDVNTIISPVELKNKFNKPVTLHNLLTHTAGFKGRSIGTMVHEEKKWIPLKDYIGSGMPPVTECPGTAISYSNHGFYLIGYIVEKKSGLPFEQYVENNIFSPIGMTNSSFNPYSNFTGSFAKGYLSNASNSYPAPEDFSLSKVSPAGSLLSTAKDMAIFMITHLQDGQYNNARILAEKSCQKMHQQQFANDSRLPGMCYGFYEYQGHGQRAIFHDGDVTGFSSRLFLIPQYNTGFFICTNSENSIVRMQLTDSIMSYLFPTPDEIKTKEPEGVLQSMDQRLAGNYRNLRIGIEYFDKFEAASALLKLTDEKISNWIELEPRFYQIPNSNTQLLFKENSQGKITHLFIDAQQMPVSYKKAKWNETETALWIPYGVMLCVFLLSSIIWIVKHFKKRNLKDDNKRYPRYARQLITAIVVINTIFIFCFTPSVYFLSDSLEFGMPLVIKICLIIPIITLLMSSGLIAFSIISWIKGYWRLLDRIHYSFVSIICLLFTLWLYNWNWLGFYY